MDTRDLKLQIIRKVLQAEDPELLQTALRVLQLGSRTGPSTPALPQEPPILQEGELPQDEDVKQLQRDIDELFNL